MAVGRAALADLKAHADLQADLKAHTDLLADLEAHTDLDADLEEVAVEADAAIRRTLARYCHTVDDGRWAEFAELWTEDAVVVALGEEVRGRDAIVAWGERVQPPERRGRHVTVDSDIVVDGDRAEVTSDFLFLRRSDAGWQVAVVGRYRDVLVRTGDGWRFARREIVLER